VESSEPLVIGRFMQYRALHFLIAILTFITGACLTAQVNQAAHYLWPDVDPQPRITTNKTVDGVTYQLDKPHYIWP